MTTAGLLIVFAGYAVGSYGVVLLRGYDISPKQWFNPLHPLTSWPARGTIPATQIWPG
jgi:hypothetical protein